MQSNNKKNQKQKYKKKIRELLGFKVNCAIYQYRKFLEKINFWEKHSFTRPISHKEARFFKSIQTAWLKHPMQNGFSEYRRHFYLFMKNGWMIDVSAMNFLSPMIIRTPKVEIEEIQILVDELKEKKET